MTQREFLSKLLSDNQEAVIIGSLGTISYDLSEIEHPNKILIRGAMGAALGCGLGYAMNTEKEVIVLVGDGAFLMKMGSCATLGKFSLKNLKVYILNNGVHKSTGGQPTNVDYLENAEKFLEVVKIENELHS